MNKNRSLGQWGEDLAAKHLQAMNYQILERNYRAGRSEIDLICREGDTLVFVEVKTRRNTRQGMPEEALTERKTEAVIRAAEVYLQTHPNRRIRFDVVAIVARIGEGPDLLHIRDAFY